MDAEITKFRNMDVFKVVLKPKNAKPIKMIWVHTYKEDDLKGAICKARCVVQGFWQINGLHFDENRILSPVVELTAIRVVTNLSANSGHHIHHLDIQLAYLNASLPEEHQILAYPPKGYELPAGKCWKLKKAVYGMKQAGYEWFMHLSKVLMRMNLVPCATTDTLFVREYKKGGNIKKSGILTVALYVDDMFMTAAHPSIIEDFKGELEQYFDLKYFKDVTEYLGIEFKKLENGYALSQTKYLNRVLKEFALDSASLAVEPQAKSGVTRGASYTTKVPYRKVHDPQAPTSNPKEDKFFEYKDDSPLLNDAMKKKYQSGVGSLLWAANNTRPDLSFAVNKLGAKGHNPSEQDYQDLLYCLRYVKGTLDFELKYTRDLKYHSGTGIVIDTFSDASFCSERDAKLVSGNVVYLNGAPVSWATKKQGCVTTSTCAAEMVALAVAEDATICIQDLVLDLGYSVDRTLIHEDNEAVIANCHNQLANHKRRPVDIKMKKIRERLIQGLYKLVYVETLMNVADMFTKALTIQPFARLRRMLFGLDKFPQAPF